MRDLKCKTLPIAICWHIASCLHAVYQWNMAINWIPDERPGDPGERRGWSGRMMVVSYHLQPYFNEGHRASVGVDFCT